MLVIQSLEVKANRKNKSLVVFIEARDDLNRCVRFSDSWDYSWLCAEIGVRPILEGRGPWN